MYLNTSTSNSSSNGSTVEGNQAGYIHPLVKRGKRIFDIVIALSGLLLLSPLLPLLAIAIKMDSTGPVLYRQLRLGEGGLDKINVFNIIKFRTMGMDAEKEGIALLATQGDPRITRVGRFLRKTRLDEVPQLVNVLLGDMSFIGPRPERPQITRQLEQDMPFFTERTYQVLPGLTGLAQINQSYLDSVNNIDQKLAYDHAYSLALSSPKIWFITDMKILLRTILTVIKCNG